MCAQAELVQGSLYSAALQRHEVCSCLAEAHYGMCRGRVLVAMATLWPPCAPGVGHMGAWAGHQFVLLSVRHTCMQSQSQAMCWVASSDLVAL